MFKLFFFPDDHEPESIINLEAESSTAPMSDSTSIISAEGVGSGILPSIDISEEQIREDDDSCHEKIMTLLAAIKEEFRDSIENLSNVPSTDNDSRCEMMQKLLTNIFENVNFLIFEFFLSRSFSFFPKKIFYKKVW